MKAALSLLFVATAAAAQSPADIELLRLMNADLLPLRSLPRLPDGAQVNDPRSFSATGLLAFRGDLAARSPEQNEVIARLESDLSARYPRTAVWWSFAYVLTSALSGRDLPQDALSLMSASIVQSLNSGFTGNPSDFRRSVTRTYDGLLALGVSASNAQIVAGNLVNLGRTIVLEFPRSTLIPIPPATPPEFSSHLE